METAADESQEIAIGSIAAMLGIMLVGNGIALIAWPFLRRTWKAQAPPVADPADADPAIEKCVTDDSAWSMPPVDVEESLPKPPPASPRVLHLLFEQQRQQPRQQEEEQQQATEPVGANGP
mmetsp:Transcript_46488/g.92095  ORF Transcript_46488/g.92095 Transcript_46488/m.92095 type:complete len:121 (+) Transcript_46488:114-476(+)